MERSATWCLMKDFVISIDSMANPFSSSVPRVRCKDSKLCSAAGARVVVTDRARTKSNRTNLVLRSPVFAAMAWLRGWPSSAPSMSSTRGCRASTSGRTSRCGWRTRAARPASWSSRSSTRAAKSTLTTSRRSSRRSGSP